MGNEAMSFLTSQLGYQVPTWLVCVVAIAMATQYFGRASRAAILTICGAGVIIATSVVAMLTQAYLMEQRQNDPQAFATMMGIVGMVSTGLRAFGLALFVAAIFADRPSAEVETF